MNEFLTQFSWQMLVFRRNNLFWMILGITFFYGLAIFGLKELGDVENFVTLIILSDISIIGFIFIGISIILEKDQDVLSALFVTPLNTHVYLLSKTISLVFISFLCALILMIIAKGFAFNILHFAVGAVSLSALFCFIAIYVVSYTTEVLHFILRSVPILVAMSLPFLYFFELSDLTLLKLFPAFGSVSLIASSYGGAASGFTLAFAYGSVVFWLGSTYWFVSKTFEAKMVKA